MNSSCAKSHMSLPLPVHTLKRVLTPRTFVYIGILTKIHISYYRYFCVWLRVVRTHICLCHCECSQLEPLCIHRYTHKYTYFILQILLCMTPCCANSHMSVPLRVLTVRTSLHTYICHKYTYIPSQIRLYINPCCAISHLYVPLRVLTLRTSLYNVGYWLVWGGPPPKQIWVTE